MNPWLGILYVLIVLAAAFVILRLVEVTLAPHPELLRKLMHVLMGLVSTSFPWLFDQVWPVVVLAGGSIAALVLVRSGISLTRSVRGVLHGVERSSWGELLFPLSVAALFVLADGNPLFYCVPILILTLADAVAALIGIYYGQFHFSTLEGAKSLEGSFAFFTVTFLCVHVAVLLFTPTGRLESLLIGLLMGVVVMMFEAVAWRGLDNLFIPVASFGLLQSYLVMDAPALWLRLIVITLLALFLLVWRRRSTLDDSALIGAGLVAYGAWAIGDLFWLLVPVSVFAVATLLVRRSPGENQKKQAHSVYALLAIAGPGLVWLILKPNNDSPELFFAYTLAFAIQLTMLGISPTQIGRGRLSLIRIWPAILQGTVVLLLPFVLMWGVDRRLIAVTSIGFPLLIAGGLGFLGLQTALDDTSDTPRRWIQQPLIAGGLSLLAWGVVHLQILGGLHVEAG